MNVIISFD